MEKINLFETNKKQKSKQALEKPKTPRTPSEILNKTSKSNNTALKASTKPISHVDLNYVKQDRLLNFYKLKGTKSKLTCHGRPTPKQVRSMCQMYKVNYCLTLQKQKENPQDVLKYCQDNGIQWQLIELDGANIAYMKKKEVLTRIVDGLFLVCQKLLTENLVLFIHCAAGLHRTGTVLYSLLRVFGETPESSFAALGIIREDTQREVGNERIRIAETVVYPELIKRLKTNNIDLRLSFSIADGNKNVDLSDIGKSDNNSEFGKLAFSEEDKNKEIKLVSDEDFKEILSLDKNCKRYTNDTKINKIEIHSNNYEIEKIEDKKSCNLTSDENMKKIFEDLDC